MSPKQVKRPICTPCKSILRAYDTIVVRCYNIRCQIHHDQNESGEFGK